MYEKTHENPKQIEENNNKQIWYLGHTDFENVRNFVRSRLTQIIFFQDDYIFLVFFEASW